MSLSASVTSSSGTVNEGMETFTILSGTTVVGSPVTISVAAGMASTSYSLPGGTAAGTYTIQAVYNGTGNFLQSSDNTHLLTINGAATTDSAAVATAAFNAWRRFRQSQCQRHQHRGHGR